MQETLKNLARRWMHEVNPRLMSFITTVGIVWLGVCLLLLFSLARLAEEVLEQEAFAYDENILLWINQFSSPVLDQVMLTVTRLGDPDIVVPITCIGVVWLWWRWRWRIAVIFAITCIGGAVLSTGFKLLFGKERPALWSQLITETSYSFPSGHALGSMVLYGLFRLTCWYSGFQNVQVVDLWHCHFADWQYWFQSHLFGRSLAHRCGGRVQHRLSVA